MRAAAGRQEPEQRAVRLPAAQRAAVVLRGVLLQQTSWQETALLQRTALQEPELLQQP